MAKSLRWFVLGGIALLLAACTAQQAIDIASNLASDIAPALVGSILNPPPSDNANNQTAAPCGAIYFDFDKAYVTTGDRRKLIACINRKSKMVVLEGHADERGTREYNLELSRKRALGVRNFFKSLGVAKVEVRAYGEDQPLCYDQNETCYARNRRVEIYQ